MDASWAGRYFKFSLTAEQEQQIYGARVPARPFAARARTDRQEEKERAGRKAGGGVLVNTLK